MLPSSIYIIITFITQSVNHEGDILWEMNDAFTARSLKHDKIILCI